MSDSAATVARPATLSDRLNPVAVREFRQAVRSKWVIAVVLLFLLANLVVLGSYLMFSPDAATSLDGGRSVFMPLFVLLLLTCMVFVPLYAGVRMSLECTGAGADLLAGTSLSPGKLLRGKFFSAAALTMLIFSVCLPFITLTYLLRGIDVPTIMFVTVVLFAVCIAGNGVGLFAGAVPAGWFLRCLIGLLGLFALFILLSMMISFIGQVTFMGSAAFWQDAEAVIALCVTTVVGLILMGLLYVAAIAMLSPRSSNRMLVPRLYATGLWMISGVLTGLLTAFMVSDRTAVRERRGDSRSSSGRLSACWCSAASP
jgi:hypothetical protein